MKYIVTSGFVQEKNVMVLVPNNWDDYSYKTTFEAKYIEETGLEIDLGTIKVGKDGLDSGWVKEYLEGSFTELSPEFFALAVCRELSEGKGNWRKIWLKYI